MTLEGEETRERMESRRSGGRNGRGEGDVVVSGVAIWWMRWMRGRGCGRQQCGNLVDATDKGKRLWSCMKSLGSNEVGNWWDVDGKGFCRRDRECAWIFYKY